MLPTFIFTNIISHDNKQFFSSTFKLILYVFIELFIFSYLFRSLDLGVKIIPDIVYLLKCNPVFSVERQRYPANLPVIWNIQDEANYGVKFYYSWIFPLVKPDHVQVLGVESCGDDVDIIVTQT